MIEGILEEGHWLYPLRLASYMSNPGSLRWYGNLDLLKISESYAVIGARDLDLDTKQWIVGLVSILTSESNVLVSGYARGTDKTALNVCLMNNGCGIMVLPFGLDHLRIDNEHKDAFDNGRLLFLSVVANNIGFSAGIAHYRNRIIYGLSDKIYISKSNSTGGTYGGLKDNYKKKAGSIYIRNKGSINKYWINQGCIPLKADIDVLEDSIVEEAPTNRVGELILF